MTPEGGALSLISNGVQGQYDVRLSVADNDLFGRFKYGTPPKDYGELAFLQHMIASCNNDDVKKKLDINMVMKGDQILNILQVK